MDVDFVVLSSPLVDIIPLLRLIVVGCMLTGCVLNLCFLFSLMLYPFLPKKKEKEKEKNDTFLKLRHIVEKCFYFQKVSVE